MALVIGFAAATASKATVIGSLLIVGIADNLTDSLSMHLYQESERPGLSEAFRITLANFFVRIGVTLSFAAPVLMLPTRTAVYPCFFWGLFLLAVLSYLLARERNVSAVSEIAKHSLIAIVVMAISREIGVWVALWLHG